MRGARWAVPAAAVLNLALLAATKYLGFFGEGLALAGLNVNLPAILAPAGVSFFTFKGISYVADARRAPENGSRSFFAALFYISFLPEVISGPLTRFSEFAPRLSSRSRSLTDTAEGLRRVREAGLTEACALVAAGWEEIAEYLRRGERRVEIRRETRETQIVVRLDLDGRGDFNGQISTGLRFLDHMLQQIAHHGGVALAVEAHGDLDIDEHHTVEDVAITLGEAIDRALGAKAGIARYGFALPMDVGDVPTELFRHFFHALCSAARCNLQIAARGENEHHKAEAIFKAFARALRMAVARQGFGYDIPSSKGVL